MYLGDCTSVEVKEADSPSDDVCWLTDLTDQLDGRTTDPAFDRGSSGLNRRPTWL